MNDDGDINKNKKKVMSMSIDETDATYSPGCEATRMTMVMNTDEMAFAAAHRYVEAQHP